MQASNAKRNFTIGRLTLTILSTAAMAYGNDLSKARADDSPVETNHLSNIRQITEGFARAGEGYFSPDGQTIVYQAISPGYPFYQIYSQRLADEALPHRISTGHGRTTCSYFSPDGSQILFASSHLDPNIRATELTALEQQEEDRRTGRRRRYQWDFDPYMELFVADPEGRKLTRLTETPGYDAECAFSPDGTEIVFCSDRDGDPDLYIMDVDGTNIRQLTNEPGYDGGPFFSPDGNWIIYRTDRARPDYLQIHAIRADGQHDIALTNIDGVNWAPYWHPTQPYIIWTGADHSNPAKQPNYDLWMLAYEMDGDQLRGVGNPIRVTNHPAADVLPVFSPDGKRLMWTSNRTPNRSSQLWLADFHLPDSP